MENKNKYNIYIGLLKSDMQTKLNLNEVLKVIAENLNKIKVYGYNIKEQIGYWNGKPEPCLMLSFINTFGVNYKDLIECLTKIKEKLEQENILIEQEQINFNFV